MSLLAAAAMYCSTSERNFEASSGCSGFSIGFSGAPQIGSSYTLSCSGGPASGPLALFIGLPDPTGTDITFIGATSCSIYINLSFLATIPGLSTDGSGAFSTTVSIANNPGDVGVVIGQQFAAISIGANPLGVVTTDLLTTTIQS